MKKIPLTETCEPFVTTIGLRNAQSIGGGENRTLVLIKFLIPASTCVESFQFKEASAVRLVTSTPLDS